MSCRTRRRCPLRAVIWCARDGWPMCCGEIMALTADEPFGTGCESKLPADGTPRFVDRE
jgi:hypothetical protein